MLLLLICCSIMVNALTFYNLPFEARFFFPVGWDSPTCFGGTILGRPQWNNVDNSRFLRNYTLVGTNQGAVVGCPAPAVGNASQAYLLPPDYGNQESVGCNKNIVQRQAQDSGFGAVIDGMSFDLIAFRTFFPNPYSYGIPWVGAANSPYKTITETQLSPPCALGVSQLYYYGGPALVANVTAFLDLPVASWVQIDSLSVTGGIYNITWIGFAYSLFVMLAALFKYVQMYTFEGGIKFSIPQMCLFCAFWCGFFNLLLVLGGATYGVIEYVAYPGIAFFSLWPFAFNFTASILLGLYLKEVSALSRSNIGAALDKLKIPAVILISFLWATIITQSFLVALLYTTSNTELTFGYFSLSVFCLMALASLVIIGWGSVSILTTLERGSPSFIPVLVIIIFCSVSTVANTICALMYLITTYGLSGPGGVTVLPFQQNANAYQYIWFVMSMLYFGANSAALIYLFIFRVKVSKEIEISKSGTSSTSSGASSRIGTSKSSSSTTEHAVEL